ncbi:hypothetical protein [Tepidimonas taiwanensis]|uniref:hypothetical protein n=1 Tax=Tepidimonas taiwanensis TaxID=307486 RepID=UPI0005BE5F4C|nr:hypothetical protein [Tepidimonas taiwanensis]
MLITVARYLLPALAGFALAWAIQGWRLEAAAQAHAAKLAAIEREREAERRHAAEAARARLEAAQAKADAAVAAQARLETRLKEEQARVKAALYALPSRPCLGSEHLGLLAQSPGIRLGPVPQAPGGALGPAAGPSADPAHPAPEGRGAWGEGLTATDTAVTGWMIDAAALYETCRGRIEALRQWAEQSD